MRRIPLYLFILMMASGCFRFYKKETQLQKLPNPELLSWSDYLETQSAVRPVIHLYHNGKTFEIRNYSFEGEGETTTLVGELKEIDAIALPEKASFLKNKIPIEAQPLIQSLLHLYVNNPLEEGAVSLPLTEIEQVIYHRPNQAANFFANAGVYSAGTVVGLTVFLLIACNCPRVYAMGPEGPVMQGSLFTGAISKSLERTDYLPLAGLDRSGQTLEITVANELPEKEYIDQLELLKVRPTPGATIGMDAQGQLFEYQGLQLPTKGTSLDGRDLTEQVQAVDEAVIGFDDHVYRAELNEATFTFDKTALQGDQVQLVIQGRQTEWLETVADYFFQQFGNEFDRWVDMMDRVPMEKYNARVAERGMSMNAYVKTAKGWQQAGTFHNAGIIKAKTMGLELDLSEIEGETVEIKLTSAYRFWELNQIGLTENWSALQGYETVPLLSATNEKGESVTSLIQEADKNYQVLPNQESVLNLVFENTAAADEIYVLQGRGYYHHLREYSHEPNKPMLKALKSGELTTHQMSMMLERLQQIELDSATPSR